MQRIIAMDDIRHVRQRIFNIRILARVYFAVVVFAFSCSCVSFKEGAYYSNAIIYSGEVSHFTSSDLANITAYLVSKKRVVSHVWIYRDNFYVLELYPPVYEEKCIRRVERVLMFRGANDKWEFSSSGQNAVISDHGFDTLFPPGYCNLPRIWISSDISSSDLYRVISLFESILQPGTQVLEISDASDHLEVRVNNGYIYDLDSDMRIIHSTLWLH
jgi:hypothetical protein